MTTPGLVMKDAKQMRLLLVEDNEPLVEVVLPGLRRAGFKVDCARTAEEADHLHALGGHDLCLLDLGLPDGDGLELLRRWRASDAPPTIVLTARDGLDDRLAGLDGGADDYVIKPVEMPELVARIRAVLRRPGRRLGKVLRAGPLALDTASRQASVWGRHVALGRRETGVLEALMRQSGRVVTRRALEDAVYALEEEVGANAIEAAVSRLRRALEAQGCPTVIVTVRGVGWMLAEPHDGAAAP